MHGERYAHVFLQQREHGHVRKRFCRIGVSACPLEAVKDVCAVLPAHAADDLNRARLTWQGALPVG